MPLRETLEKQGNWLFKWRSYLPLLFLPVILIALRDAGLLQRAEGDLIDDIREAFCVMISLSGLLIRCLTIGYAPGGTSGRNTREQRADVLNTTGMYSIVRHPLYFGNFIISLGGVLFIAVLWFNLSAIFTFWLYYMLIMFAEEEFLREKFGKPYLKWAENTPAFFPELPFSFKNVIRREYSTLFAIIAGFTFLDLSEDFVANGEFEFDWGWAAFFAAGFIIYTISRILKKSGIFDVKGR
jgi:protein-S-isoprenylcysteine O-methyltransferase Ste14